MNSLLRLFAVALRVMQMHTHYAAVLTRAVDPSPLLEQLVQESS